MFRFLIGSVFVCGLVSACSPASPSQEPENKPIPMHDHAASDQKITVDLASLATEKDLVCGMPLSAGVSDTLRYDGKTYGFCSAECKEAFQKTPKQYLTNR